MGTQADGEGLLVGATVQRADVGPRLVLLRVREPGKSTLLLIAAYPAARGVAFADARFRKELGGLLQGRGQAQIRARLEGAHVQSLHEQGVHLLGAHGPCVVEVSGSRVVVRDGDASPEAPVARAGERDFLLSRGAEWVTVLAAAGLEEERARLKAALASAAQRLSRRAAAVRGDLARVADAETLGAQAQWLVGEAARTPRGATALVVTDWSSGEPRELRVALDPARSAREQVEAMFKRARRIKRGAQIAQARLAKTEATMAELARIAAAADGAPSREAIRELAGDARSAAPLDFSAKDAARPKKAGGARPHAPHRTFLGSSGKRVLVGRSAAGNDELTLHVARPHDLFVHAKGAAGAHVIVVLDKGHDCPSELLVDAAHLAAHFSDNRGEAVVEVSYVPKRFVRKPRGSAPGLVTLEREKVLLLRVDRERLAGLLARESLHC
jgi:hypothetical protein